MTLFDRKSRSSSPEQQGVGQAEHVTQTIAVEDPVYDVDEVWHQVLTSEEEDFLREIQRSVAGLEPGILGRWLRRNEIMYTRKDPDHWRRIAQADGRYRDELRDEMDGDRLPERFRVAYRASVLADLEENEDGTPVVKGPEPNKVPSPVPEGSDQDSTQVHTPEIPASQPAAAETSQALPQARAPTVPIWGQGTGQSGHTAEEAWRQASVYLVQQHYGAVLGTLMHLDQESRDPRYAAHGAERWRRRQELEMTLASLGQQLQWYSALEQTPLAQFNTLARSMYPNGYPGVPVVGGQGGVGPGMPPARSGANFAGYGTHAGFKFGAPANSARQ
ncbi:hypothetical protein CPB97_005334 [Podila verticillata]|nr:hypothetical protein CPB97_005334 [Podila verticillata]